MAWFDRNPSGKAGPEPKRPVAPEPQSVTTETPPEASPKEKPPPRPAEPVLVASLHKGSRVTGQLVFQGQARIDGTVEGEIQCHGKLSVGEGAEVRAKISGQVVVIQGRVEGNITATEKIELMTPARLYGNVHTPRLIIAEGVVFDGDCSMGVPKQKSGLTTHSVSADKTAAAQAPRLQADSEK